MSDYITALGWIVAIVGGLSVVTAMAWLVSEAWWRIYSRTLFSVDWIEAAAEWREKHPEKAKAFDARAEKVR